MAGPRFAIGLDIGSSGVRAAQVAFAKPPVSLEGFGQVGLPYGAMHDGEVVDQTTVAAAISQLWRHAGFRSKKVSVGVANQKVVVRPIDLPYMPEQELRGAMQFQVQEYIPIPVEDAVLDFQILDEYVTEREERMMRVLLVAAQKEMVSNLVATVQRAGLDPVGVDVTPLALVRSVGEAEGVLGQAGAGEAIVDVGAEITNIVVHEGGIPRFVRILLIGGTSLTEAVAAGLGVSFEDAENIKHRTGISPSPAEAAAQADPAPRILEERAAAFINEVRGTIDYYLAQAEATRISRVVLTGGGSKLHNLPARLTDAVHLPVEVGSVLRRLRVGRLRLSEDQLAEAEPLMGPSVGLALGMAEE